MNAGGKKAVLWGTALDNLASWRMVTPRRAVARGRAARPQPRQDPRRARSRASASRRFERRRQDRARARRCSRSRAAASARQGLGKDVTDKFLAGLPGVQKEGCDGIITSATFILHRMPTHVRTVCLEFFGDVKRAVPAIVEIKRYLDAHPAAILAGLEHLDERYVKAVGYATKAKSRGRPRMVLLGDIVGDDEDAVAEAASHVVRIANARDGEGFVAASARGAQALLARPRAHRGDRAAHQRVQDQRGRGDPARAPGRLHRRHRAHQHRAVDRATS